MTCPLKYLTWKTAFLLTITSACASEMHMLSCEPAYFKFSNVGVTMFTRLSFRSKVPTRANTTPAIFVPVMHNQPNRALCIMRALNEYLAATEDR